MKPTHKPRTLAARMRELNILIDRLESHLVTPKDPIAAEAMREILAEAIAERNRERRLSA